MTLSQKKLKVSDEAQLADLAGNILTLDIASSLANSEELSWLHL